MVKDCKFPVFLVQNGVFLVAISDFSMKYIEEFIEVWKSWIARKGTSKTANASSVTRLVSYL